MTRRNNAIISEANEVAKQVMTADTETPVRVLLKNGTPLYIAEEKSKEDVIDVARAAGETDFYILGATEEEWEITINEWNREEKTKIPSRPQLYRVIANAIGYVLQEVETNQWTKFSTQKPDAWFELPKMPFDMVQKVDAFFREVYRKIGTEAVVILGFDSRLPGNPAGWRVYVPHQVNNGAHCDYSPESIVDDKDDDVDIVGTIHSHPGMSAFASHTDHSDQATQDGIHITFGWRGSNSSFTEYHCELQMNGHSYDFNPGQIFESRPDLPKVEELDDWMKNVSKETFGPSHQRPFASSGGSAPWQKKTHNVISKGATKADQDPDKYYDQNGREYQLPEGCPDTKQYTVVARLLTMSAGRCPVCDNPFRSEAFERRRCWDCWSFLLGPTEEIADIIAIREGRKDTAIIDLVPTHAPLPIMVWERSVKDGHIVSDAWEYDGGKVSTQPK